MSEPDTLVKKNKFIFYAPQLPPVFSSAASARCKVLLEELRGAGFEVKVLTHGQKVDEKSAKFFLNLPTNRVSFLKRLLMELFVGLEFLLRIVFLKFIGKLKNTFIILSSPPYIVCLMASWGLRLFKVPYILDIRDLYPEVYFYQGLINENSLLGKIQKNWARSFYKGAKQIFAATEGLVQVISTYLDSAQKVELLRNGYDESLFFVSENKESPFTCVFHGNLGYMQNIDLLIDVAKEVYKKNPLIKFLIIGGGPQEAKFKNAMTSNISYMGEINYQNIPSILSKAHLGLSFRRGGLMGETAFPVKVFEYVGAGLPVIVTPMGEAGACLEEQGMGLQFENEDLEKIANKILELSSDESIYEKLAGKVKQSRMAFSRQGSAQNMIKPLNNL